MSGNAVQIADLLLRQFGELQQLTGAAGKDRPRFRQGQMPFPADEQRRAELGLQTFHLGGKRRLAHVQLFRRPGDVQLLGNGDKIAHSP